ncbi:HutD family protein [Novosphingobium sp.]|uniref:HutD/Ves family protein n=1 Tax=Novosphingobium sp. TaxID=1874826 RepID=UPI00286C77AF|nr:HutD family protein [Novosphingobium sp.]
MRARDCVDEPWRNGAGRTRTLWSGEGARISVAVLECDAPFSAYAGYDRTFCLLGPDAVSLIVDGAERVLAPGQWTSFAGEAAVAVRLEGGPVRALNVMTARGLARHAVQRAAGPVEGALLVALAGDGPRYDAGDLLVPPYPNGLAGSFLAVRIS